MIWSKYNYLFFSKKFGHLLYNSSSNSFANLDEDAFLFLHTLKTNPDINIDDKTIKDRLIEMKVIVDDDKDEFYKIKYQTHYARFFDKSLHLTINPTLHCNFGCIYCFEASRPAEYMSENVQEALISFIKKHDNIKGLHITWFGGEPLMAFNIIKKLSTKIKDYHPNYSASMITNGYLLSEEVINQLLECNITSLQITIDGNKETHNKRRPLSSGKETFKRIIHNIDQLLIRIPNFNLRIRVNIDESNKEEFIAVVNFFKNRYKQKIHVYPGFVDGIEGCKLSDCLLDRKKKSQFTVELYKKYGIDVLGFYPDNYRYECPVRNPHHHVIGPKGEFYKCWNDVGNEEKIVASLDKGIINSKLLNRYYVAGDPFDDKECIHCIHIQTCGGGCPYLRIQNEFEDKSVDTCDLIKDRLEEYLEIHYERMLKRNNKM